MAGFDISPIATSELPAAVDIFLQAFFDNVRLVYGDHPRPDAMLDVWSFARSVEPEGFLAARDATGLLGYVFYSSSVSRLRRAAILRGQVFLWMLRALSSRYGIRWLQVMRLIWNKALFIGSSRRFRMQGDAQLVNIAVRDSARGRGVATKLVEAGLQYLHGKHIPEVRLEVRPDNEPAIKAYHVNGFVEKGRTRDIHGEWLVMIADLSNSKTING